MIIAVAHGAIAGGATPVTPIGVIITGEYAKLGIESSLTFTFLMNAGVNLLLAIFGAALFGGRWWLRSMRPETIVVQATESVPPLKFARRHALTIGAIAALLAVAKFAPKEIGLAAFAAAAVLFLTRAADERTSIAAMPWNVILLVAGVSTFVALCERTGAVELLSQWMQRIADDRTLVGWSAFFTGIISIFSSTSGVVLPTFLPTVGTFVRDMGSGVSPAAVAAGIVVGSSAVDVSPLSTIGALCIAAAAKNFETRPLFNRMLIWGFAMAPLSAMVCQVLL